MRLKNFFYNLLKSKFLIVVLLFLLDKSINAQLPLYKNINASAEARSKDLLSRMTLEEKIGQLSTLFGWEMYERSGAKIIVSDKLKNAIKNNGVGMLWGTLRADPWTQKTLTNGLNATNAVTATNAIQKYAIENSRLGIPLLLAEECAHGLMAIGTTVFPTSIGQASTFNDSLIKEMGKVIAIETRNMGSHIAYGPILDISRDPRWSRVEETYGEDPFLAGAMGVAFVKGLQGNNNFKKENVISTLKHFIAYGASLGGHNGAAVSIGRRELFQYFLQPFERAVMEAKAMSVMTSYNSVDGIPATSDSFLLRNVLQKQWGFNGFVVSDLGSISGLKGTHNVAATPEDAAALSINAGVHSDLGGYGFAAHLHKAINEGKVSINVLDEAVLKCLKLKFEMGLFENPYRTEDMAKRVVYTDRSRKLNKNIAKEAIVLLKNTNLPLNKNIKNIAVIGPNAHNIYNQLGDYTAPQPAENVITVLDGIKNKIPKANVMYAKGCDIRDTSMAEFKKAIEVATQSEVIVAVMGGSSARDFKTEYETTGAAKVSTSLNDMENGEGNDRMTLGLLGVQLDLLKELSKLNKPVILVLINGRPMTIDWEKDNIPNILEAWYPGAEGGDAIADILFGDYNPSGKLPVSFPKKEGQLPVYYNHLRPAFGKYVEGSAQPLFPFGFGLSYSNFEFSQLLISTNKQSDQFKTIVSFNVKNTSDIAGEEVAQLYISDLVSSVVSPIQQLVAYKKVFLNGGESKKITFELNKNDFKIYNQNNEWTVEEGIFEIKVGSSSDEILLKQEIHLDNYKIKEK